MGLDRFLKEFQKYKTIAIDSMVFIYHMEDQVPFSQLTTPLLAHVERGRSKAITSTLTLLEVLVHPYRQKKPQLAVDYRGLLLEFPHLEMVAPGPDIMELAASIRAHYEFRTPDAIQLATAIRGGAGCFVSNDKALQKIKEIPVLLLDTYRPQK